MRPNVDGYISQGRSDIVLCTSLEVEVSRDRLELLKSSDRGTWDAHLSVQCLFAEEGPTRYGVRCGREGCRSQAPRTQEPGLHAGS